MPRKGTNKRLVGPPPAFQSAALLQRDKLFCWLGPQKGGRTSTMKYSIFRGLEKGLQRPVKKRLFPNGTLWGESMQNRTTLFPENAAPPGMRRRGPHEAPRKQESSLSSGYNKRISAC